MESPDRAIGWRTFGDLASNPPSGDIGRGGHGGGVLQLVLMRHPPQLSVKTRVRVTELVEPVLVL